MAKWINKKLKTKHIKRSPVASAADRSRPSPQGGGDAPTQGSGAFLTAMWKRLWGQLAVVCGFVAAYGAICLGVDIELVNMAVTALYAALALQR